MKTYNRICAWCGKLLGVEQGDTGGHDSHGICKECAERMFKDEK